MLEKKRNEKNYTFFIKYYLFCSQPVHTDCRQFSHETENEKSRKKWKINEGQSRAALCAYKNTFWHVTTIAHIVCMRYIFVHFFPIESATGEHFLQVLFLSYFRGSFQAKLHLLQLHFMNIVYNLDRVHLPYRQNHSFGWQRIVACFFCVWEKLVQCCRWSLGVHIQNV